jgi:hypothetical protein
VTRLRDNYTFRGEDWPSLKKLRASVEEWNDEANAALQEKPSGKYSRRYLNAVYCLRMAYRRLELLEGREAKQKEQDELTPKEIVDRVMDR